VLSPQLRLQEIYCKKLEATCGPFIIRCIANH